MAWRVLSSMKNQQAKRETRKAKLWGLFFVFDRKRVGAALLPFACCLLPFALCPAVAQSAAQLQGQAQAGEQALQAGRYEEAAAAYEKLRDLAPQMAEAHARLGLAYFQLHRFEQAVPAWRQAIKLKPGLPGADLFLAMSLAELGHFAEALPALEKGFKRVTDDALKRASGLQLQRAYTGTKQDEKAVEVMLELIRRYPKDAEVLYHAGRVFGNAAYLATVRLNEVAPDSVWLHLAAGEANESQGRTDAAIEEYKAVLSIQPARSGVHYRIGRTLLARARQATDDTSSEPAALQAFERELEIDPTNANAAYEAAEIHRRSARFDRALDLFSQAVKQDPNFEEALVGQGRTLLSLGKAAEAIAPLRKAIAVNAANEVSWFQLAQAQRALGNAAEQQHALAEFQKLRNAKTPPAGSLSKGEITKQTLDAKPNQ
jgi:tetratricopeptide (TPR) repeat protein